MSKQNISYRTYLNQTFFFLPCVTILIFLYFKSSFFSIYIKYLYLDDYCLTIASLFFFLSILFLILSLFKFKKHYFFFSFLIFFFAIQSIIAFDKKIFLPINISLVTFAQNLLFIFVLLFFIRSFNLYRKNTKYLANAIPYGIILMYTFPFIALYLYSSLLSGITAKWFELRQMPAQYFIFDADVKISLMICSFGLFIFCFQALFDQKIYQNYIFSKAKTFLIIFVFLCLFIIQTFMSNLLYAFNQQSIGRFMASSNLRDHAITLFQNSLNVFPHNPKTNTMLGTTLVSSGHFDKGFQHIRQAIKISPFNFKANINAGLLSVRKKKYLDAQKFFSKAIWRNPKSSEAHHNLGFVYSVQNKIDLAIVHFRESIRLNPDDEKSHFHLALLLCKQKKHKQALGHFQEALWIEPDFVEAYVQMGTLLFQLGAFEEAFAAFKKALHFKPDSKSAKDKLKKATDAAFDYVKQLTVQKKFDEAISIYKRLINYRPDYSVSINYNIACLYAKKKQVKESLEYLEKAIQMGYKDWDFLKKDTDFDAIRDNKLFAAFINKQK